MSSLLWNSSRECPWSQSDCPRKRQRPLSKKSNFAEISKNTEFLYKIEKNNQKYHDHLILTLKLNMFDFNVNFIIQQMSEIFTDLYFEFLSGSELNQIEREREWVELPSGGNISTKEYICR